MSASGKVMAKKGKSKATRPAFLGTNDEAIVAAEQLFEAGDLEGACDMYQHAATNLPDNVSVLDAFGAVLFELGRDSDARAVLQRSVSIDPSGSHSKYMILAQISKDTAAKTAYQSGITLLQAKISAAAASSSVSAAISSHELRALRRELSKSFCSLAELYMTDLCDEDDAEAQCAAFAQQALHADETNPEAYNVAANLRLCQKQGDDARALLRRCAAMLLSAYEAVDGQQQQEEDMEGVGPSTATSAADADPDELPPWESRMQFAKTCSEAELYAEAAVTLDRLIDEDDSEMEAWFLYGEALTLDGRADEAVDVLEEAHGLLGAALGAKGVHGAAPKGALLSAHLGAVAELKEKSVAELQEMRARFAELLAYTKQEAATQQEVDEDEDEDEDDMA